MAATPDLADPPPFISECEVLYEGGPSPTALYNDCGKNPGHPTFIPVKEFSMDHLPNGYNTEEVMTTIKAFSNRTVRVTVKYTSLERPATFPNCTSPYPFYNFKGSKRKKRLGTGFVVSVQNTIIRGQTCSCLMCKTSGNAVEEYREFVVSTATHVIFDDSEAEKSTFELFYDSEKDRENVRCLYGVKIYDDTDCRRTENIEEVVLRRCYRDNVKVLCVSHDTKLDIESVSLLTSPKTTRSTLHANTNEVEEILIPRNRQDGRKREKSLNVESFGILISHPHGKSKCITIGNILHFNNPDPLHILDRDEQSSNLFRWFQKRTMHERPTHCRRKGPQTILFKIDINTQVAVPALCSDKGLRQNFLKYCNTFMNSTEFFIIKKELVLSIPIGSPFLCRRTFDNILWATFPPGTKFRPSEEKTYYTLPDNTKFDIPYWRASFFKTYDIDSCPGCSGAPLIREFKRLGLSIPVTHSGTLNDGTNRSALQYF